MLERKLENFMNVCLFLYRRIFFFLLGGWTRSKIYVQLFSSHFRVCILSGNVIVCLTSTEGILSLIRPLVEWKRKKNFMAHFMVQLPQSYRETTWRQVTFTTKFPEIPAPHLIDLGRMTRWMRHDTQWFRTRDPWIGKSTALTTLPLLDRDEHKRQMILEERFLLLIIHINIS